MPSCTDTWSMSDGQCLERPEPRPTQQQQHRGSKRNSSRTTTFVITHNCADRVADACCFVLSGAARARESERGGGGGVVVVVRASVCQRRAEPRGITQHATAHTRTSRPLQGQDQDQKPRSRQRPGRGRAAAPTHTHTTARDDCSLRLLTHSRTIAANRCCCTNTCHALAAATC